MTDDDDSVETLVVQKVSVSEVAEVRDQLKQLVRIGFVIMLVIVGVQVWGVWQDHQRDSCAHDIAAALNARSGFNTTLDDITSKKFELDKALTNRQLSLDKYNLEIDRLSIKREETVAARDNYTFPSLKNCA